MYLRYHTVGMFVKILFTKQFLLQFPAKQFPLSKFRKLLRGVTMLIIY